MTTDPTPDSPSAATDDIESRVLKVIATTKRLPRESVTPDSSFESLSIDSLDRLNILFDLESEFDIQINDEDAKRVETIPQMVAGVRQLVEARESGEAATAAPETASATAPVATKPDAVPPADAPQPPSPATNPSASGGTSDPSDQ